MSKTELIEALRDALDRIARFAEAYDAALDRHDPVKENVGSCLCVVLGRYARKVLSDQSRVD